MYDFNYVKPGSVDEAASALASGEADVVVLAADVAEKVAETEAAVAETAMANRVVYAETHNPTTTDLGLFSVAVGNGTPFARILWTAANARFPPADSPHRQAPGVSASTDEMTAVQASRAAGYGASGAKG